MKYLISIFEKFESQKLSGVVNYISKPHRKKFLDDIKKICGVLDYPISNLSDDKFNYLRFKDAYNLQDPKKSEDDQTKCVTCIGSGKIKKPWGKEGQKGFHYRDILCKDCGGTGKQKEKANSEPLPVYLKFWFNTNGEYLGITRYTHKKPLTQVKKGKKTKKVDKWKKIGPVQYTEIEHLQKMYIELDGIWTVSTMWRDEDGDLFAIHDNDAVEGYLLIVYPSDEGWEELGQFSFLLGGHNGDIAYRLVPKTDADKEKEDKNEEDPNAAPPDPDIFNIAIDATLKPTNKYVKDLVKDAEFSLILNLDLLRSSEYTKSSKIKKDRLDSKAGSLHGKKEEEIRKENIDRYISKLSSYDPKGDLNQIKTIIPRFFGWNHPAFFLYYGINYNNLSGIISNLFRIHRGEGLDQLVKSIKDLIMSSYLETSRKYPIIIENIQKCKKMARDEKRNDIIEFINGYEKINKAINDYLGKNISKISDLESTERKIKIIRELLKSERYQFTYSSRFLNYLSTKETDKVCTSYDSIKHFMNTNNKERLIDDINIIYETILSLNS